MRIWTELNFPIITYIGEHFLCSQCWIIESYYQRVCWRLRSSGLVDVYRCFGTSWFTEPFMFSLQKLSSNITKYLVVLLVLQDNSPFSNLFSSRSSNWQSRSQSHIATDGQSVCLSWCFFLFESYCPVHVGRPLSREVGSVVCQS
jgi:hypothetical protein